MNSTDPLVDRPEDYILEIQYRNPITKAGKAKFWRQVKAFERSCEKLKEGLITEKAHLKTMLKWADVDSFGAIEIINIVKKYPRGMPIKFKYTEITDDPKF